MFFKKVLLAAKSYRERMRYFSGRTLDRNACRLKDVDEEIVNLVLFAVGDIFALKANEKFLLRPEDDLEKLCKTRTIDITRIAEQELEIIGSVLTEICGEPIELKSLVLEEIIRQLADLDRESGGRIKANWLHWKSERDKRIS